MASIIVHGGAGGFGAEDDAAACIAGCLNLADPHRLFGGRGGTPYNSSALVGRKGLNMGLAG